MPRCIAKAKDASSSLDNDMAGRKDAFNPAELLRAALGAFMLKSIERSAPMLDFARQGVDMRL